MNLEIQRHITSYPGSCLTGSLYVSDAEEMYNLRKNLIDNIDQIDPEIIPYLHRINLTEKISTVFCCWGHLNTDYDPYGNLLFRSSIPYEELYQKVLRPLQEKYHYSGLLQFMITLQPWYGKDGTIKQGYAFLGLPKYESHKHEFYEFFCNLLESI